MPAATEAPSIAALIGAGYAGEDLLQKEPWIRVFRGAPIHIVSRIDPAVHYAQKSLPVRGVDTSRLRDAFQSLCVAAASVEIAYDSAGFADAIEEEDETDLEAWLGLPLQFMASMDRRFYDRKTDKDRRPRAARQVAARWVRYFRAFFRAHKTTCLVTTLEDDLFCVTAVQVARRMGIRVLSLHSSRFPGGTVLILDDFRRLCRWNPGPAPAIEPRALYPIDHVQGAATSRAREWSLVGIGAAARRAPFVRQYNRFRERVIRAFPAEAQIIPPLRLTVEAARYARGLVRRYATASVSTREAPEGPYFLYPLHFEQDAQVTFRTPFLDQIALIRQIARCLPSGTTLLVKPHAHFAATDQSARELRRVAELPGIRIAHPGSSIQRLIESSTAVITINSTAGIEAMAYGRPVVALGDDFYCKEPPAHCPTMGELGTVMSALRSGQDPYQKERRQFFQEAYHQAIMTSGTTDASGNAIFTDEDGAKVARALAAVLKDGPWKEQIA